MERESALESAYKFGAGRYHQQRGAVALAGEEAARLGRKRAYLLAGPTAFALAGARLCSSLEAENISYVTFLYSGQCSVEQAHLCARDAAAQGCGIIFGIGGGRVLDLAKVTARIAGLPVITVPTISATSAPFTHMSVMYTPDGHWVGTWYLPNEVNAVLADMDFLSQQPKRYLASGAVDAMAKWMEICHPRPEDALRPGGDTLLARLIARQVFDRLALLAPKVYAAEKPEEADLWEVCFLSMAGAAMVSGTARCLRQSALAHAVYEWARRFRPKEVKDALHGEIVGVGLRAQGLFNGDPLMTQTLENTLHALRMPMTLADLGLSDPEKDAGRIAAWMSEATALVPPERQADFARAAAGMNR